MIYHYYNLRSIFDLFPNSVSHFRLYEVKKDAALRRKEAKRFLQLCLKEKVIPKTMIPTVYNNFKQEPFPKIFQLILQNRIATINQEINYLFTICQVQYLTLRNILPIHVFKSGINFINRQLTHNLKEYKLHLSDKLSKLCTDSLWSTYSNPKLITNLSDYRLNFD